MQNRQEILKNRNRIRNEMKVCLVTPKIAPKPYEKLNQIESPLHIRLKNKEEKAKNRKKSEDLSIFQNPNKIKQLYISENFFDLFEVQEKLGDGAHSVVKRCVQKLSEKVFAVKFFRKSDKELSNMLKTQFTILKSLNHENIIKAFYLFVNQKQQNSQLVMQYYCFQDLAKELEVNKTFDQITTSEIISSLLNAVIYLHEKGICHRDIKPQNILYNPFTKQIKLIDFEISKMQKNKFQRLEMWTRTGSMYYKAPQMFVGKYNELIDVWAIGVLTYELLTGKLPFYSEYQNQFIGSIKNDEPEYPQYISNFAKDFIRRCLIKNPLKRCTAKEALSSPFLLQFDAKSSTTSNNKSRLNHSFDQILNTQQMQVQQENETINMQLKRCFAECDQQQNDQETGVDIGIRCCESEY